MNTNGERGPFRAPFFFVLIFISVLLRTVLTLSALNFVKWFRQGTSQEWKSTLSKPSVAINQSYFKKTKHSKIFCEFQNLCYPLF